MMNESAGRGAPRGRGLTVVLLLLSGLLRVAPAMAENGLYHQIEAVVLVADPARAAEQVTRWAEQSGGYFLHRSDEAAVIRFPSEAIGALRAFLEEIAEEVVTFSPRAMDLQESLLGIRSGIRGREEILEKNLAFIDQAGVAGTLAIEREVLALMREIETLKGRLRKLEVDGRLARAVISFRFMEQSVPTDLPSSFAWLNSLDFFRFMQEGASW